MQCFQDCYRLIERFTPFFVGNAKHFEELWGSSFHKMPIHLTKTDIFVAFTSISGHILKVCDF